VSAAAGSGKTLVVTERVKYLLDNKLVDPEKLVVITYTTSAAQEMSQRLGRVGNGVFIGTIHAYAYYLLVRAGYDLSEQVQTDRFDEFFTMIEQDPSVIKPVDYIFVDEFQDCGEHTVNFIFNLLKPKKWFIVGDIKQSIYRFIDARPDIMVKIMRDREVVVYDMDENFRNAKNILIFAKRIISYLGYEYIDLSIGVRDEKGAVVKMDDYTPEKLVEYVSKHIKENGENYGDWFILSRTNQEKDKLFDTFMREGIPCDTFRKSDLSNVNLKKRINENTVKVLTIHQAKGLENKYVAVVGAKYFNEEERCIAYVAATRAKDLLVWCKPKPKSKKSRYKSWD
jgi:DNA helicase-2/ATP-dependent DNA helicase PcrA